MLEVEVTVQHKVKMRIDEKIENSRDVRRKVIEKLARDGFVNSKIKYMTTTLAADDELDLDFDDHLEYHGTYMYGKI